ncbi:FAD dependent oxidoreductase [Rhizobium sp. BK251]|nr:FAD dependent oxidoreductase [Rhizobium sp. BK251]
MAADFKYLVVGRGMMGAAAARHLAKQADGVGVIGPDEPLDRKSHDGVFASHYDEGRITRTIDPDADWALLANRSIARYDEIARESGIDFYQPAGCLIVGAKRGGQGDFIERTTTAAKALGVEAGVLDDHALSARFPFFSFPTGSEGVHETTGAASSPIRRADIR